LEIQEEKENYDNANKISNKKTQNKITTKSESEEKEKEESKTHSRNERNEKNQSIEEKGFKVVHTKKILI